MDTQDASRQLDAALRETPGGIGRRPLYGFKTIPAWKVMYIAVEALRKTSTRPLPLPGGGIDVRTVMLIHTTQREVIEISMTGPGVWAVVNGHPAELNPELSLYLGTLFGSESW